MALFTNFTPYAVGETVGTDARGAEYYLVVVKATFSWDGRGVAYPLAEHQIVTEADVYAGPHGESSVVLETDFMPQKPRTDVVLLGAIELPAAVEQVDATLEVGRRIKKTARVFGDRLYMPTLFGGSAPARPRPFQRMPIVWERSFGGVDPESAKAVELRNLVGVGMRHSMRSLEARPAPNFEDPRHLIDGWTSRPPPMGFGPIGRSWQPRAQLAGTYDAKWEDERYPLFPLDFNPLYFNCAPQDQQLDGYLPGEEVRLTYMTRLGHERFLLPAFGVEVKFLDRRANATTAVTSVDTVVIEPAERRFSLISRALHYPKPNVLSLRQVRVGTPSRGWRRANDLGKRYLDFRRHKTGAAT